MQGEGPEFYSEAKAQVRADVSLLRGCGTLPVGRKDLDHRLSDRLFCPRSCTATIQRPVPSGGKLGGKIVKRRARGVVAASGREPLVSVGQLGPMATALAFGVPACRWPQSCGQGRRAPPKMDREPDWKTCVT